MKTFNDSYMFYSSTDTVIRMPELMETGRVDHDGMPVEKNERGILEVLMSVFGKN